MRSYGVFTSLELLQNHVETSDVRVGVFRPSGADCFCLNADHITHIRFFWCAKVQSHSLTRDRFFVARKVLDTILSEALFVEHSRT